MNYKQLHRKSYEELRNLYASFIAEGEFICNEESGSRSIGFPDSKSALIRKIITHDFVNQIFATGPRLPPAKLIPNPNGGHPILKFISDNK